MDPIILVPEFDRLSDWVGLWCMEPRAFDSLIERIQRIDLVAHAKQPPMGILSSLEKVPARGGQSIAVVKVMGTLMKSQSSMGGTSTVQMRRDIRQAAADPEVSSILLAIDSPGGTTAGTDDLANEVKQARRMKPVVAHIDDLGASAAYWVASQAEQIYANSPTALIGSIGTFMTVYDASEAAKMEGIKAYRFATGPLKGAGTPGTPLTEEQQAYFQQLTDESQQAFDGAVRKGRGMTEKQLADVRSGAVWTAENAQSRKLIDGIRSMGKTLEEMTRATTGKATVVTSGYAAETGGGLPFSATHGLDIPTGVLVTLPDSTHVSQPSLSAAAAQGAISHQAPQVTRSIEMNDEWIASKGFDPATINDKQRASLAVMWASEQKPANVPVATLAPAATVTQSTETPYEAELAAARREGDRQNRVDDITQKAIRANVRFPERIERFNLLRNAAIEGGWDLQRFQLEMLKEHHNVGPIINVARNDNITTEMVECAAAKGVGFGNLDKHYGERVCSAVDKRYKRGIGLKEMISIAAEQNNGYRGSTRDLRAMCRAAFTDRGGDPQFVADVGPSTISVSGILSNLANKFLETGFLYTEQAWRQIAKIRPANDYKEMTIYRLGGSNVFEKVGRGGELKHGTLSELAYGLKADIYGKVLGITEQDIRNDDLSAFAQIGDEMGRGGGDSLNQIFWAEFNDDATFFPTDKSKANYDDGAVDSVLSFAGLNNAETMFRLQTKPDGTPLGAMPSIILTGAGQYNTALQMMGSQGLVGGTTPGFGTNIWYGRYKTVSSVFLDPLSATAWYLLADPNNVPTIAICFLDGVETPTVETGQFDFDQLGLAMRGTLRFGVRKQEYRGGVKLKGAA